MTRDRLDRNPGFGRLWEICHTRGDNLGVGLGDADTGLQKGQHFRRPERVPQHRCVGGVGVRNCGPGEGPSLSRSGQLPTFGSVGRRFNDSMASSGRS